MPGQWQGSTRAARLPPDWHARRARTARLAGNRCQHTNNDGTRCTWTTPPRGSGQPGGHADHIHRDQGDEQHNLQWLCPPHHYAKSSAEGHDAARQARTKAKHPIEQHPSRRTPTA